MSANQKSLRELIERRPPRLSKEEEESMVIHTGQKIPTKKSKWRQLGASTIKFEFVLTLTKNIVPLIMILVMGEVRQPLCSSFLCNRAAASADVLLVVVSLWICSDLSSVFVGSVAVSLLLLVECHVQPMNGLAVSMGIGYVIRNYIPEMRIETLHIWLLFAGSDLIRF